MRALVVSTIAAALLTIAVVGSALADHSHNLVTPGTTVVDLGAGQTSRCATDPGGHQFHKNVHLGTPGTFAFAQAGQVKVIKTEGPNC